MCFSPLPVQGTLQVPRGGGLVSEIDLKSSEKEMNLQLLSDTNCLCTNARYVVKVFMGCLSVPTHRCR